MPDNLNVGIGIDTKKLAGDVAIVKSQLRELASEVKKAADEFNRTGNRARLDAAEQATAQLTAQQRSLERQLRQTNRALVEQETQLKKFNESTKTLAGGMAGLRQALTQISEGYRAVRYGVIGLAVEEGVRLIGEHFKQLSEVANKLLDIKRVVAAGGAADVKNAQIVQEAFKAVGLTIDDANAAMVRFGRSSEAAFLQAVRAGRATMGVGGRGTTILRAGETDPFAAFAPGAPTVLRQGGINAPPPITTAEEAFRSLGIRIGEYQRGTPEDDARLKRDTAAALEAQRAAGREAYANEAAFIIYGKSAKEMASVNQILAKPESWREIEEGLKQTGAALARVVPQIEAFTDASRKAADQREGMKTAVAVREMPAATAALGEALKGMLEIAKIPAQVKQAVDDTGQAITAGSQTVVKNVKDAYGDLPNFFGKLGADAANSWNQQIQTMHTNLPDWLKNLGPVPQTPAGTPPSHGRGPEPGGDAAGGGNAAGGYISGPGTGTSDSILARLSNGEFVVNARSVQRLGLSAMRRINSFADGGYADDFDPSRYDYDPDRPGYSISKRYQAPRAQATLARDRPRGGGKLISPSAGQSSTAGPGPGEIPLGVGDTRGTPLGGDTRGTPLGSGTPVHIHIGGGEYKLWGSDTVARQLADAARRQQTASAGTMPSWYGG